MMTESPAEVPYEQKALNKACLDIFSGAIPAFTRVIPDHHHIGGGLGLDPQITPDLSRLDFINPWISYYTWIKRAKRAPHCANPYLALLKQ
jgi:hypothetical protein